MPIRELNPEDAVNRDVEQEEFTKLVQFPPGEDARLVIIRDDKPDSGKTTLLRCLKYNCERTITAPKPVCLIPLEDTEKITSAFELVKRIVEALSSPDFDTFEALKFPTFQAVNDWRVRHVFTEIGAPAATYAGSVHAEGAQLGPNAVVGGIVMTNPSQFTVNAKGEWGPEQEEAARQACVKAFFADLKVTGDQGPIVILLDSFDERSHRDVREWVLKNFVRLCFDRDNRPQQFVLVLAGRGRELPDFSKKPEHARFVKSRSSLSDWTKDHVLAFLKVHAYDDLTDIQFEMIWEEVQKGTPIGRVLKLADLLNNWRQSIDAA